MEGDLLWNRNGFFMEKAPCKGISLWKMVSVKGLNGKALSKGTCFGTGMVSLLKGVAYGKGPL